ncbi:MAG: hypothetical protein RJQ04_13200 [Longimicrobiales bacterium]
MAVRHHILPDHGFVLSCLSGALDDAGIHGHVSALNERLADASAVLELADCRTLRDLRGLSVQALISAANREAGQPRIQGGRLAVVVSSDLVYGLGRVYTTIAAEVGRAAEVFRDVDAALDWLGDGPWRAEVEALLEAGVCRDAATQARDDRPRAEPERAPAPRAETRE